MAEGKDRPFVVTDRRRFTTEGEVRPDAPPHNDDRESTPTLPPPPTPGGPQAVPTQPVTQQPLHQQPVHQTVQPVHQTGPQAVPREPAPPATEDPATGDDALYADLPAPTAEQTEQSRLAYEQTADRLDTAIRATNPGMDHPPAANFESLVQSLYVTAIVQLGGMTQEGQKPQIDLLGARQSIDLLAVLRARTTGNLSPDETKYLDSALFEVRMAFLEITQSLARSAAGAKAPPGAPSPFGPGPAGARR